MEARAKARYVRVTPRKARRVVDLIRGLPAEQAQAVLAFAPQSASDPVGKVLASAIANAEYTGQTTASSLVVSSAWVDEGPTINGSGRGPRAAAIGSTSGPATSPWWSATPPRQPAGWCQIATQRPAPALAAQLAVARPAVLQTARVQRAVLHLAVLPVAVRGPASGPESEPAWVPARHHHRLQEPVVRRQAV